jgi:hypothetical protein
LGGNLTRESLSEDAAALRPRDEHAKRVEPGRLLTEVCATTGDQRKAAIRLLQRRERANGDRRGRTAIYDEWVRGVLKAIGETSGRWCSQRLVPFRPALMASLERHGELVREAEARQRLLGRRAATVDRLFASVRRAGERRPFTPSRAMTSLQAQIPLRTLGEWAAATPGEVQAELVAHCGEAAEGQVRVTWTAVAVATRWTEGEGGSCAPPGSGPSRLPAAPGPFPLRPDRPAHRQWGSFAPACSIPLVSGPTCASPTGVPPTTTIRPTSSKSMARRYGA